MRVSLSLSLFCLCLSTLLSLLSYRDCILPQNALSLTIRGNAADNLITALRADRRFHERSQPRAIAGEGKITAGKRYRDGSRIGSVLRCLLRRSFGAERNENRNLLVLHADLTVRARA